MSIVADKKNGKLNGRFRVQVMVNYVPYRRRVDTLSEARALEAEWLAAKAKGLVPPPNGPVEPRMRTSAKPSSIVALPLPGASKLLSKALREAEGRIWPKAKTASANEANLGIIHELMGDVELDQITTRWVLDLKEKLKDSRKGKKGEPISDATINRFLASLSKFLQYTIDKGWRTVETLPKMEYGAESEGRIRWFSPDEEADLMRLLPERSRKLVAIDIRCGLRREEILSLELDQIGDDCVHIWKSKSGSPRTVPITRDDANDLRTMIKGGTMPTDQMLRDDWELARAAMGLREDTCFVFHACRHTYATRAVQAGVPIRVLQKLMGHKTIQMTERYSHVHDEMLMDARDRMFGEQPERDVA